MTALKRIKSLIGRGMGEAEGGPTSSDDLYQNWGDRYQLPRAIEVDPVKGSKNPIEDLTPLDPHAAEVEEIDPVAVALRQVFGDRGLVDLIHSIEEDVAYYDLTFRNSFSFTVGVFQDDKGFHLSIATDASDPEEETPTVDVPPGIVGEQGEVDLEKFPVEFILKQVEDGLPKQGDEDEEQEDGGGEDLNGGEVEDRNDGDQSGEGQWDKSGESLRERLQFAIRGGKKVKVQVKRRFTRGGKRIRHRISMKMRMALKKARRAANRPSARRKRIKSGILRRKFHLKKMSQKTLRAL